jgi:O-antigen/teichoic acid export membrane protein
MSNPLKKLAGQTAVYGLSSILGRFLNYLLVPLYTSALVFKDPADYGVVSELYAWVAFLMVLLTFGMETAFFKFLNDREDKKHVFNSSLLSVLLVNGAFLILLLLFHSSIAERMLFGNNPEYIILLGIIVVIDAVSALPLAKLRAENRARRFAFIQLTSIGVNIGLNLVLLLLFFDKENPEQGVRFILIANIIASLVKPAFVYKDFLQMTFKLDFTLIKLMLRYSFPLALAGFAFIINETIDRILLKHLTYSANLKELGEMASLKAAEAQVGIYSASYKLAMLVSIFLQAYRYAAEPFFFAEAKNQDRNKTYVKVMNYFVGAVFLCFLGVSLNIDIIKHFIPNPNYWEGLKIVPILLLANVFLGIYINQSIWYKLSGQTKFGAYIAIVGALFTIGLNLAFIPTYGYIACAWVTLIVYGGQMVASYLLGQKHYPIPYNLRKFGLYSVTALLIFLLFQLITIEFGIVQLVVHNLFIVGFVTLVWFMERGKS